MVQCKKPKHKQRKKNGQDNLLGFRLQKSGLTSSITITITITIVMVVMIVVVVVVVVSGAHL